MSTPVPPLHLSLQWADKTHRDLLPRHRVARWLRVALSVQGRPGEITVRVVGEEEGRRLNREFRQQDHATNVMTFDYAQEPLVAADLVLCAPVIEREAREQGRSLAAHYAHMLVHGALHAQGFDHLVDEQAVVMEAHERAVMARLGFADPYA